MSLHLSPRENKNLGNASWPLNNKMKYELRSYSKHATSFHYKERGRETEKRRERERERLVNIYYGIAISLILYKSESGRSWYKLRVVYSQE
jgi:hypothetical protein